MPETDCDSYRARDCRRCKIPTAGVFRPLLVFISLQICGAGADLARAISAGLMIEDALIEPGLRSVCIREVQKSLKESAKRLIEDKLRTSGLARGGRVFKVFREVVETPRWPDFISGHAGSHGGKHQIA